MAKVGTDVVTQHGGQLQVQTRREMPDWAPTRYRRTAVRFHGQLYEVARYLRMHATEHVYVLLPWADRLDRPARVVEYDETFVRERDRSHRRTGERRFVRSLMLLVLPVLGFLPARAKAWLHEQYELDARLTTKLSLMLQFAVVLSCAGALCVLSWAMAFAEIMPNIPGGMSLGKTAVVLMAIVSVLGPDLIPRYDGLMKGTMRQWGLYEWAPPLIGWIVRTLRQVVRDHRS